EAAHTAGLKNIFKAQDHIEAATLLRSLIQPNDLVLVKGSRTAGLERIFFTLENSTSRHPVTT
ncbi:MAG: hypothetical protein ACK5LK_12025, partial [Chthoniobacterales bacterium]